jgi:RNA polymerase sigma-70 factor (ECF subfamily)
MMDLEDANEEIDEETPAHIAEKAELKTLVNQAVNSLPHYQRIVVELHEFEGLSHKEIAEILNCSEGTVWSRLHRARERLKKMLAPYLELEK